ncbi:MAG: G1 family glutamic endopeptidase [Solirubrobacteraceae bacterium]
MIPYVLRIRPGRTALALPALAVAALVALLAPGAARADSSQSTNWAGYAVHRSGIHFRQVVGAWTQPAVQCTPGSPTYSSMWVGIGGYSMSSQALEQIGTEADCSGSGRELSSAWYELVPADSRTIALPVAPGDGVVATVTVAGREVTLTLADAATGRSFHRTLRASQLDTTSAEWILEAPSLCSGNSCRTLPLANFGSTGFAFAGATSTAGDSGPIQAPGWNATSISMTASGQSRGGTGARRAASVSVVPTTPSYGGSLFTVSFDDGRMGATNAIESDAGHVPTDRLVHAWPGGARLSR